MTCAIQPGLPTANAAACETGVAAATLKKSAFDVVSLTTATAGADKAAALVLGAASTGVASAGDAGDAFADAVPVLSAARSRALTSACEATPTN